MVLRPQSDARADRTTRVEHRGKAPRLARLALLAIGVITILTGLVQAAAPALVLRIVGGATDAAPSHFFAIVGMFMVLFGGLLWQSVRGRAVNSVGLFWAALQKVGAAAAVGLGVQRGLFSALGLAVAAFDLASGLLALWYWRRTRSDR